MGARVTDRDRGWKRLLDTARALAGDAYVKVGVLADDERGGLHKQGSDGKAEDLTVAEIAAVNEFGTEDEHVPARSFLRPTFDREREALVERAAFLLWQILDGKVSVERALQALGQHLMSATQKAVTRGELPLKPNAASTVARKGSSRPLVDTGTMVRAITYAVFTSRAARRPGVE